MFVSIMFNAYFFSIALNRSKVSGPLTYDVAVFHTSLKAVNARKAFLTSYFVCIHRYVYNVTGVLKGSNHKGSREGSPMV